MNKPKEPLFTTRPTVTLELPLDKHTHILHPEQVILRISDKYHDIGALCYALRSHKTRKPGQPCEVVTSSFLKQRPKQILQLIKAISNSMTDGGKSAQTTANYARCILRFINWADCNCLHDCLAGGDATRHAFRAWAVETKKRYNRQLFGEANHNHLLIHVCKMLEATTGLQDLMQGIRIIKRRTNPNGGTEPLALHDFAHAVALNQCLFDGLCDLVLEQRPFPYKLDLPSSLGWEQNHLWLFPTTMWRLPPHLRDNAIRARMGTNASWSYDYERGRLATPEEIACRYKGRTLADRVRIARKSIKSARTGLVEANIDAQNTWRLTLAMHAQRSFMFLFFCNTGGNEQVVRDLETEGKTINATVLNQKFRAIKWRAGSKEVPLVAPATFMPRLRRFMELRQYLLQGRNTPYLFFGWGKRNNKPPAQISMFAMECQYRNLLLNIDPQLPRMGPQVLRASVEDYYQRLHGSVIASVVTGHTIETGQRNYNRGSANEHLEEMTLFMTSVSESARRQRIIPLKDLTPDYPPLEEGGRCDGFGHPEALADHAPVQPNCKDTQGCLFCTHRVLIAGEEDARKVASAAFVMEQVILGPKHEEALRPLIAKCDQDLKKISAFPHCRPMVEKVRKDVFENCNLTPFFADKFELFLQLGVIA